MNNLDFSAEPLFSWYVVALAASGILLLGLGAFAFGVKFLPRILAIAAGIGLLYYAYYMAYVFEGGTYTLYYKLFVLPVLLIVYMVKAIVERGNAKAKEKETAQRMAPFNPNAPQAPYNPTAPQAPFNPNVPPQPVADNPYAQPVPPAQPGQPQPPVA
ncbi:hypothetical protein [Streptomyces rubellomurinus]|uniref:Uncharacterized protein n=1 Tax=Streptomyces rubellomurinus (strain ATCC 31215) TaxID=359131 RepID=A0A0F2TJV6_STRR3|nr:hypothetical protein [Streptomyces rubellomurinus]KJS62555.1 hypothetical protein VM95_08125 [Streptomyces rubellomurinus]